MLKLSQKKRKALLALVVAATVLGANNAFAASVHDKAISESNNYGASMRTYWQNQGVYDAANHTYTFNEDITLKPKTSEQNLNFWTPLFGGIYVAGYNPVTIDMQGHRLDVAMNMDPVAQGAVFNPGAISPNVLHVTSSSLTINNVKGMELSAGGPGLATGNITGIYLAGTNQEGSYHDGKGLSSLTINNEEGWDNAIKFHSSQDQVENGIYVWKNSGSADLKISGLVDMYVGNGSDVITVRGGDYTGDTQGVPTAYIGGGAFKASTGRAANVVGGLLSVNSKLENGEIVASDANRDVQIDGNIRVGDVGKDQGTVTLGLNTADSYFKGIMYTNNGEGDAYMMLQNGAQWTNTSTSQDSYDYHGSSLKQFVGSEGTANTGYIFQKDNAALNLGNYSGYTTVFYEHDNDGTKTADYTSGNVVVDTAKIGSNITLITNNVDVNNDVTVKAALNALAGKLYYNAAKNGENALGGMAVIAEGLTASSKALKTADIYFDAQTGQGTTVSDINQTKTEFTTTLTGVNSQDGEYAEANVIKDDGSYKFKKDSSITTDDKSSIDLRQAAIIDAKGKTLTLNANSSTDSTVYGLGASSADGVTVNAGKLVINGSSTNGRVEGINVGQGAQSKDKPMKLTINGDTEFNMKGIGYTLGLYANGNSEVTFNGNVTAMGNENSEWGLTSKDGAFGYYGCSLVYSGSNYSLQMGPKVTINGDVNAKIDGNGLFANGGSAKLTINGGGNIEINKDNTHNYYALLAESGTTSLNVNLDDNYQATSARDNKLVLKGNVTASTGAVNPNEPEQYTYVNLGLATADSEWTGVAYNKFGDAGKNSGSKTFYGAINVFLQNGATWNNEEWGEVEKNAWGAEAYKGSHLAKLIGGSDAAHAGNIFQKDENDLTIDNYSGNTNIFYAHTGNGEAADDYAAGDTIIRSAAEGSVVSMITDNTGISMDNKDSVNNVLNALAGKLTYSNFVTGEKNLTGYVKVADGLTASSKALETGDISFSKEDGKGYYNNVPKQKTQFTTAITGDLEADTEYAGNIADGKYFFDGDSTITVGAATAANIKKALTIDAGDHKLSFIATGGDWAEEKAFKHTASGTTKITAGELVIGKVSDGDYYDRTGISVEDGTVDITAAKTTIYAQNDFANVTYGVHADNGGRIDIHGDLDLKLSCGATIHGLVADKGASINVDGKANIDMSGRDGNAVAAINSGSAVNVGGGTIKAWNGQRNTSYGLLADSGIVNVNMNDDKTAAGTVTTVISGNVRANGKDGMINVGLSDKESSLTGVAFSQNNGVINMYLNNGASWNNQVWGKIDGSFDGSHVAKLAGGASEVTAGNIFQRDGRSLTIDNYSGNTNIFYAHTGNGEAASDYAAGDTIIRSAAEGSAVSLITDNSGIAMDNEYSVANVLNTLAGKLTYSSFVTGEKNLTGYVKIAEGLTASSAAKQTGNIAFNADTGKGSLENGSMKPGFTYPETQKPEATEKNQGITGDAKTDYQYKKDGILKKDGSYVFTQNPTKIEVESGAAVKATDKDINIDTTKAKLELKGETGIKADGANVAVKGSTEISGNVGIDAVNGNVTLNGSTVINGTDAAINAGEGANVDINTNNSALNIKGDINANGGSITVASGKATGVIAGDISASKGGSVEISLNDAKSSLTGSYRVDDSSIVTNIANGATWNLTDDEDDAEGMSLFRMAKAPAATADKGLTINGGESKAKTGYLNMTKRTKNLNIASYSGWETIIYGHENAGDKDEDYKSGDTIINKAAKDSGVILSTDNSGINMGDKAAVEATLKALAHKLTYTDHEENGSNLTGKVQIADGLTASSASKYLGNMRWDENGKGQYVVGSIQWEPTIETGDYETFVMKGARSAVTTSFHSWRDNMQDTYTGADLADEDGIFAKALGGKTSSDVSGLKDSNSYWGAQIGYDKALANGWHTGVAFDYRDGDSDYLLGGKGDNKLYSFGVYGVKKMDNGSYFRVAAKAGRVENEYDVYTELRNKLHADYKANAYGLTAEYGKTFGSEMSYITPKVQLTWSRVGSKDYTGSANNGATMNIYQDSYDSLVGRLGFEAGMKKAHGSLHAGLYLAHEFNGDIDTRYFAKDGGWKSTSFDGDDTWAELVLGGEYRLGRNSQLYADFARDLGGDFQRKWKLNAGIRLRF